MGQSYLIRYGLARSIARFEAGPGLGPFERGRTLVVRSHRGVELGVVVAEAPASFDPTAGSAPILRDATAADLERGRAAEAARPAHFAACREVFAGGEWPLELIDTEPLLDEGRTVLHYLGPHRLDASGLIAAFRSRCNLDVVLEPAGLDLEESPPEPEAEDRGCGSCGSSSGGGGCGSGGCGSCGSSAESGGCAVKAAVASRRIPPASGRTADESPAKGLGAPVSREEMRDENPANGTIITI